MVEHPEEAALVVLWESADALKDFENSPLCVEFLQSLGCEDESKSLFSLQYDCGFCLGEYAGRDDDLHGRISLTIFEIPYTGVPDHQAWRWAFSAAFGGFMPKGCEDLRGPPAVQFTAMAYGADQEQQPVAVENTDNPENAESAGHGTAVCYHFFRWNINGASTAREEASVREPEAHELWAEAVAKAMPPIVAREEERWDIEVAPCYIYSDEDDDDDGGQDAAQGSNAGQT